MKNNVIPIMALLEDPLEIALETLLNNTISVIRLAKPMEQNCPQKFRNTLAVIKEMISHELYYLDKDAA